MAPTDSLVIEVPTISRVRESSADQALVSKMSAQAAEGTFVTDGKTYKTHKEASNNAQVYRRALAARKNLATHQVKSRVWGVKGDTIVTDPETTGAQWKFALSLDPSRQKRKRNTSA